MLPVKKFLESFWHFFLVLETALYRSYCVSNDKIVLGTKPSLIL